MRGKTRINRNVAALIYVLTGVLCILLLIKYSKDFIPKNQEIVNTNPVEIEVWTIHGDIEKALNESLEKCKEQFPEIEFNVKVLKNEVYQSAIANAMVTDTLPDIFFNWGYQKLKDYVDAGAVLDITDYIAKKDIMKDMKPGVMDGFTFDDKSYAMPLYGWNVSLFCNRSLFEQYDVSYPRSYDELLEVIKEFKKNDIIPIATGGKEPWLISLYYMSLVLDTGTISDVYEAANDRQKFNSTPFVNAALQFEELVHIKPWQTNFSEDDSYNAAYLFTQGNTAMLLTGSWVSIAIDAEASKVKGNVDVLPFPNTDKSQAVGGYVDTYVISKKSIIAQEEEYINLYIDLMESIAKISCDELGIGVPAYYNQEIDKDKFPTLYQCILNDQGRKYHPAYDQIFNAELTNQYYDLLSELMLGEIQGSEFIESLVAAE